MIPTERIPEIVLLLADAYCDVEWATSHADINAGLCLDFAEDLCWIVGRGDALWLGDIFEPDDASAGELDPTSYSCAGVGHCAALIDGLWYDSETPQGVADWLSLGGGKWAGAWHLATRGVQVEPINLHQYVIVGSDPG